jgi:hypothetical protein
VYRESSISVFDFVGGQFVWQVRELSSTVGLSSPECIVEVNGMHYFIGDGDIKYTDGNVVESLLHNKLRKQFVESFDSTNYANSYIVRDNINSEKWFCVPQSGAEYPNVAYIYNHKDDSWTVRDMPEAPSSAYGFRQTPAITWAASTTTWENVTATWSQNGISPLASSILGVLKPAGAGLSGQLIALDSSDDPSVVNYKCTFEKFGIVLDGFSKTTTIQSIYPHMRGAGSLTFQIGSQAYPGSVITWKPPVVFTALNRRKIDIRTTGEIHCMRMSADFSDGQWALSGLDIHYVPAGER